VTEPTAPGEPAAPTAPGEPAAPAHPLRLAEAAAVLSLATDLSMGQPLEHGLRCALVSVRIARALGLAGDDLITVYYTGILHFAGCTAESEIDAGFFGDESAARPQMLGAQFGSRGELIAMAMRTAHQGKPAHVRAAKMARSAVGGIAEFKKWARSHCDVARLLGARMGFSDPIQLSLKHLYERWDGKGMPGDLRGEQIPQPVRIMQVAQDADIAYQRGGPALARTVLDARAGSGLDPQAVAAFLDAGDAMFDGLDEPSVWDEAMAGEPGPQPAVTEDRLDDCLSAVADFADLKSTWTVGHSRGVAGLAEQAAIIAGLDSADVILLRRAALVHDLGRVAVPVSVWAKPGPLTRAEREQVRLHAYHTERVLDVVPGLRPLGRLAGSHGERGDGSGYHRGSRTADLPLTAWLLAAADCYQAMREPRAYREPLTEAEAAAELCREMESGRLAPEAANAVLVAAGQPGRPVTRPAGLSERECQVLRLLSRGLATKQIARQLGISPKTCDHHIQRVYGKAGVSTRAGATLFAMEHGLLGADQPGIPGGPGLAAG
jgi:HD-GYP domain-containing protein (c-di-GMP phosphodiesterase class II)